MAEEEDVYFVDEWPKLPDGSDWDGKQLLTLVRSGKSPFHGAWDVNILIREIEENLAAEVIDIPCVYEGANNYGIHLKLSNRPDIVARLACGDVNMPDFSGFHIGVQVSEVKFEAAVYELLRSEPHIMASHLLYHRVPVQQEGPKLSVPQDIACLLARMARIRASLFNFHVLLNFTTAWFLERLFEQKPKSLPVPVAPSREFCMALFTSKIEATIGNIGDMIGWESDNNTIGPIAASAK
ncbi:MAG: hypothetical protein MMC33_005603 [Icmadophila ericetorum]|nr:hypothetical protein [Icmadophila ericetorum]